jgi:hypothetical protein
MSRAIAQPTRALLINSQRLSVAGRQSRNGRRAASIARDSLVARCCGWPRMRSSCGHVRGGGCAGEFPARAGRTAQPSLNPRIYPYFSPARRTAMAERSPLPAIGGGQPFGAIAPLWAGASGRWSYPQVRGRASALAYRPGSHILEVWTGRVQL